MTRVRLVTIAAALCGALGMTVPSLAAAGSVSGTVTAAGGGGIPGIQVCFRPEPETFDPVCAQTGAGGQYKAENLPGAGYVVRFDAEPANLNYVSEYYDDAISYRARDLFTLGGGQDAQGVDAELAPGGSIGGTVTDEVTGQPIAGIRACARDGQGFELRCASTGPTGQYQLNGLPSGRYSVEYEGGNRVNYLREFYEDAETWAQAEEVEVIAPGATTAGIDAKLAPGAQILGRVTEVGSGAPLEDVMVCAEEPDPFGYQACDRTDAAGDYAIRSLPAGTYLVAFEPESLPTGRFAGQWWQGAATKAEATPITIAPPQTRSGIDGQLPPKFTKPKLEPIKVTLVPTPLACGKGFRKKTGPGGERCVRKVHCRKGQRKVKRKGKVRCVAKRKPQRHRSPAR